MSIRNPQFLDQARRVSLINEDGTPATLGGSGSGSSNPTTSPNAPTQVATASGSNFVERDVAVGTASTALAPSNATARFVEVIVSDAANTPAIYVAVGRAATANKGPVFPAGGWASTAPITASVNAIVASGTANVIVREYL